MKAILKTVALLFVLVVSSSRAQIETEEGDEICSCSPTVFRFTMNFAGTCPGNLDVGDGIANNDCQTLVLGPDQGDTSPVIIDTLTILELNDDEVINSTTVTGPFADGDAIVYASISSYRNLTEFYFPVGLEMTLTGENENQETIVNIVSIRYDTSECGVWPVIPPDTIIGWVDFATVEDALRLYCPEAPATPTVSPTEAPVETVIPTTSPTVATPSVAPADTTVPTTTGPAATPSVAPVDTTVPTTTGPAATPSVAPVETTVPTTTSPVATPSVAPAETTVPMTTSPVEAPSAVPVATVTPTTTTPVETPSASPVDTILPTTTTPIETPSEAPVTPPPAAVTDPPASTPTASNPPVTPSPALEPGPTLPPSPVAPQPTPDEPPQPLPPVLFPTIDAPTVDYPDLPPSKYH
jgi:hypothetical protein